MKPLTLTILRQTLAICRLDPNDGIPSNVFSAPFWSATRTEEEISLVVPEESVPLGAKTERGWRCIRVEGPLDFDLTGILSSLAAPLAKADISIFAVSTFDTDYILVREFQFDSAVEVLSRVGHRIVSLHG